jgi:hypothetical protein
LKKQLTKKEKDEYIFILSLITYSLGNKESVSLPQDVDFKSILKIAEENYITNILSYALSKAGIALPEDIKNAFIYRQKYMLMKDAHQFASTKKFVQALENAGVDNLVVKGEFIKNTYPQPDYRVTADVDIHIKEKDFSLIKEVAKSLDFKIGIENENLLIVYQEPFSDFEVHRDNGEFKDTVFDDLFKYAVLSKNTNHTYKLKLDDHFIYVIEHYAKHYRDVSGMGIRMVLDVYCLYNCYKDKLNFKYINKCFKKSGIYEFYKMLIKKGEKYFVQGEPDFDIVDIFILTNGIMGTEEIYAYNGKRNFQNNYGGGNSNNYILRRIFPPAKRMAEEYPVIKKNKLLLPALWIHRCGKILFGSNRKQYFDNVQLYKKYGDDKELSYFLEVMRASGFDI